MATLITLKDGSTRTVIGGNRRLAAALEVLGMATVRDVDGSTFNIRRIEGRLSESDLEESDLSAAVMPTHGRTWGRAGWQSRLVQSTAARRAKKR